MSLIGELNKMQFQRKYSQKPQSEPENSVVLSSDDARELRIIKQAILKSAIEGGVVQKRWRGRKTGNFYEIEEGTKYDKDELPLIGETDEEFIERWLEYVYRNTEKDKKLTENSVPF